VAKISLLEVAARLGFAEEERKTTRRIFQRPEIPATAVETAENGE